MVDLRDNAITVIQPGTFVFLPARKTRQQFPYLVINCRGKIQKLNTCEQQPGAHANGDLLLPPNVVSFLETIRKEIYPGIAY